MTLKQDYDMSVEYIQKSITEYGCIIEDKNAEFTLLPILFTQLFFVHKEAAMFPIDPVDLTFNKESIIYKLFYLPFSAFLKVRINE